MEELNPTDPQSLQSQYNQLLQTFDYVCKKYSIKSCSTCKKYRKNTIRCVCGAVYCKKCTPAMCNVPRAAVVRCVMCGEPSCSNCLIDNCSECDRAVCRRESCVAYICDASRRDTCTNIICRDCCETSAKCQKCAQTLCRHCRVGHEPCHPILCSCKNLVYPRPNTQGVDTVDNNEYPVIKCSVCDNISCDACKTRGQRHRAYHAIIPFIIANNRGDLPTDLPFEIVRMIWERCLE